jgi:hypothetical protein
MHVRPATNHDVPALATCFARAFEDDKLFAALHPRRSEFRADFTASFERLFQTQLCKRNCIVLVVDGDEGTTQAVAGVAVWERDGTDGGRDINPRAGILLGKEGGMGVGVVERVLLMPCRPRADADKYSSPLMADNRSL